MSVCAKCNAPYGSSKCWHTPPAPPEERCAKCGHIEGQHKDNYCLDCNAISKAPNYHAFAPAPLADERCASGCGCDARGAMHEGPCRVETAPTPLADGVSQEDVDGMPWVHVMPPLADGGELSKTTLHPDDATEVVGATGVSGWVGSDKGNCARKTAQEAPAGVGGGEILTREEYAKALKLYGYGKKSILQTIEAHDAALRARVAELERVIEEAEHGRFCMTFNYVPPEPCDCFKSKAKVSG